MLDIQQCYSERVAIAAALKAELGERRGRPTGEITENFRELKGRETAEVVAEKAGFGNETLTSPAGWPIMPALYNLVRLCSL